MRGGIINEWSTFGVVFYIVFLIFLLPLFRKHFFIFDERVRMSSFGLSNVIVSNFAVLVHAANLNLIYNDIYDMSRTTYKNKFIKRLNIHPYWRKKVRKIFIAYNRDY